MNEHIPHRWVITEISNRDETFCKVLAGWRGGYLDGDSYRVSSRVEGIKEKKGYLEVTTKSGATYICHKHSNGLTLLTSSIITKWEEASKGSRVTIKILGIDEI